MRCPSCSAEVNSHETVCPTCHCEITAIHPEIRSGGLARDFFEPSNWLNALSRYVVLPILVLVITHYILFFVLEVSISSVYVTLIYGSVAFLFGYDLRCRAYKHVAIACGFGLVVGVIAVTGMSASILVLLNQPFFPDKRHIQDFVETSMAIMLAYAAGNATADFILRLLPDTGEHKSCATSIRALMALARGEQTVTQRLLSIEAAIKALTAVVLAVGALLLALKALIF